MLLGALLALATPHASLWSDFERWACVNSDLMHVVFNGADKSADLTSGCGAPQNFSITAQAPPPFVRCATCDASLTYVVEMVDPDAGPIIQADGHTPSNK